MAERLKAVASKAIVRIADRGFESLSLRHSTRLQKVRGLLAEGSDIKGAKDSALESFTGTIK
jgi:hypothetical protein